MKLIKYYHNEICNVWFWIFYNYFTLKKSETFLIINRKMKCIKKRNNIEQSINYISKIIKKEKRTVSEEVVNELEYSSST